ncbi:MAG: AAA family ATPase [Deltaproteobacteria bacterium]|nr:AAA family ATPase [Deltaproteobacteria bacterium]
MYEEYFGLSKKPFSIAPNPHYLYLSAGHAEALAHLVYGVNSEGGFILLTGDVGTGKTTVCRRLLEMLPAEAEVAFILNPELSVVELLASICREFKIDPPPGPATNPMLVSRIHDYLLDLHIRGRRAILILEEAQNLQPELLEQIRLLTNLETNEQKLLQVIMIGQPELRDLLDQPGLRQLSQRITARYHLGPLSREETDRYVQHRLSVAGFSRGHLFPPATLRKLYRLSRGIPRLINVIADRALLGAYVQEKDRVDPQTLKQAAREATGRDDSWRRWSGVFQILSAILALLLVAVTAVFLNRYRPWTVQLPIPATVSRAPEPKAATVVITRLEWPGELTGEQTRRMAHEALLSLWGFEVKGGDLCREAAARGLGCLPGRGSLTKLRLLNKPAVLTLVDERKGRFYATLTNLRGGTATVVLGQAVRVVELGDINRLWSGDYLLVWRVPPDYRKKLEPGDQGPQVAWLKQHLALAQGQTPPDEINPVYDPDCVQQVKRFQKSAGLVPDGIVGPMTIIPLSAAAKPGDPILHDGKGTL